MSRHQDRQVGTSFTFTLILKLRLKSSIGQLVFYKDMLLIAKFIQPLSILRDWTSKDSNTHRLMSNNFSTISCNTWIKWWQAIQKTNFGPMQDITSIKLDSCMLAIKLESKGKNYLTLDFNSNNFSILLRQEISRICCPGRKALLNNEKIVMHISVWITKPYTLLMVLIIAFPSCYGSSRLGTSQGRESRFNQQVSPQDQVISSPKTISSS